MVETGRERLSFEDLPFKAKELIGEIREHHKLNKLQQLRNRLDECRGIKQSLRSKYAELIELMAENKPEGVTHFRLSNTGDLVFINNNQFYGQTFKRLASLYLPLC